MNKNTRKKGGILTSTAHVFIKVTKERIWCQRQVRCCYHIRDTRGLFQHRSGNSGNFVYEIEWDVNFLLRDAMHSAAYNVVVCDQWPSACHVSVLCGNGWTYPQTFFIIW